MMFRQFTIYVLGTILLLAAMAFGQSQVPLPPDVAGAEKGTPRLPDSAKTVADDYLEQLKELREKLSVYRNSLARVQIADELTRSISRVLSRLDEGDYTASCDRLTGDLDQLTASLEKYKVEVQAKRQIDKERTKVRIESLQREMEIISATIEQQIALEMQECNGHEQAIAEYVQARLNAALSADSVMEDFDLGSYPLPSPAPPAPPTPPTPPSFPGRPSPVAPVGKGLTREYEESIRANDFGKPIVVVTKPGDIIVKGARTRTISSRLSLEVSATSREMEKQFAEAVKVVATEKSGRYEISVQFPELSDPDTRLLTSLLTVEVPTEMTVVCDNSYGNVTIAKMRSAVEVTGNHSNISIADCKGVITVTNSLSPVSVSDADGEITITNSYSSIALARSSGELALNNRYGPVTVLSCTGELELTNSGPVTIRDYSGPVRVDNSNGIVQVSQVDGDVWAFNSYQPLYLSDISGRVRLENANALIHVTGVGGRLTISNRFGSIDAREFIGPLKLESDNGTITLQPGRDISGVSTVSSAGGTINLIISPDADLHVDAETLEGDIISTYQMAKTRDGDLMTGSLTLGSGNARIALTSNGSTIAIKDTE